MPSNDPGVCTRISSTPIKRLPPPMRGAPGVGASRSPTLAPCFAAFGELAVLNLSRSDAADSSSGVHDGEDCVCLVDRLATGSSRRSDGGTCGLATGPMTPDVGGVGSWTGLTIGVRDSGDKGSHDEMEGRRVLCADELCGRIDCEERRFMGLSATKSAEELESYSSLGGMATCLRFG